VAGVLRSQKKKFLYFVGCLSGEWTMDPVSNGLY